MQTRRLTLEPFDVAYIADLHRLWTDAEVRRYLWDDEVIPYERTHSMVLTSIASADAEGIGMWWLRPRAAPTGIGFAGLRQLADSSDVELLYGLEPAHWHQGLATEASWAVLQYAFADLRVTRVLAGADPPNSRSFGVMRRLGMSPLESGLAGAPGSVYWAIDADVFRLSAQADESTSRSAGASGVR